MFRFIAMYTNLREKPDLRFTVIDHTGIMDSKFLQQYLNKDYKNK
jgi:hypothetical protein